MTPTQMAEEFIYNRQSIDKEVIEEMKTYANLSWDVSIEDMDKDMIIEFFKDYEPMSAPRQIKFYKKVKNRKGNTITEAYYSNEEEFPTEESRKAFMKKYKFYKYTLI